MSNWLSALVINMRYFDFLVIKVVILMLLPNAKVLSILSLKTGAINNTKN